MAKDLQSINLLDNKGKGFTDQFLDWALAIGRLLVIITETIALTAFLYRFSIDRKLIDLHDEIKQYNLIVSYDKNNEAIYRHMQKKISISKTQQTQTAKMVTLFNEIMQLAEKNSVTFKTLTINGTDLVMSAQARSITTIEDFFAELRKRPDILSLSVDKVENKTTNAAIIVSVTATLKDGTKKTL